MNLQTFRETLGAKYEYLFKDKFGNQYDLLDLHIVDVYAPENKIAEITVDITVDYNGSCDPFVSSINKMLTKIVTDLSIFLSSYPVNPETFRIDKNYGDFLFSETMISYFDFKVDESHKVSVSFVFDYQT